MNALTSYLSQLSIKKKHFFLFLFLSLLINDCILIYLETIILYIYNFLILFFILGPAHLFLTFLYPDSRRPLISQALSNK